MNDKLKNFIDHKATVPSFVGLLSFGGGAAVGYFFAHKLIKPKPQPQPVPSMSEEQREVELARIREAVEESRRARAERRPPPVVIDADEMAKIEGRSVDSVIVDEEAEADKATVREIIQPYVAEPEAPITVGGEVVEHNIFAEAEDGWDMDVEVRHRNPNRPYVVHRDEFFEEGDDYSQRQLTYYNGDDTLVDEDNKVIENHSMVVGEMKWGHGSGDPNVVYIRNERLRAEYEIFLEAGQYRIEILGEQPDIDEVKHSVKRMPRET